MQFMMNFMRHHQRLILAFILIFIGIPFVFVFGMPQCGRPQGARQDDVVAMVGEVPILGSAFRRNLNAMAQRTAPGGERLSYQELDANGTANRVLDQMIDGALVAMKDDARGFTVDDSLAIEQMKKWPDFRDAEGNFNPRAWNAWIAGPRQPDWAGIYGQVKSDLSRQVYLSTVLAPAGRVLDKEIDKQLEESKTKLRVKYAKVEPKVEPSNEEIETYFGENAEDYRKPSTYVADFVTVSLIPDPPEKVLEALKKAREGADFAALSDEYSDRSLPNQGDMGWRSPREDGFDAQKALFDLALGEVSDPVPAPGSYQIYKAEEERINEETGKREVRGRRIYFQAKLKDEDRAERQEAAQNVSLRAKELGSLTEAAAEAGLEVQRTSAFTREDREVDNVPRSDVFRFRSGIEQATDESRFEVVEGQTNLYVTDTVSKKEGALPTLDEVWDQVQRDVIAEYKKSEEYGEALQAYCDKISEEASTLSEASTRFPELALDVKESEDFTRTDTSALYRQGLPLVAAQIYAAFQEKEPGTMTGPLSDFQGGNYFVELVAWTEPTEEERAGWTEERKQLRERMAAQAQQAMLTDFTKDLRERMLFETPVIPNVPVLERILGRNVQEGEDGAEAATPAGAAATDTGASEPEAPGDAGASDSEASGDEAATEDAEEDAAEEESQPS